jgi:hypothetical protein
MAVPVADRHNRPNAYAGPGKPRPLIPVPPKRSVEFRLKEFRECGSARRLPKDRTNRPQGKAFLRPLSPSLL